MRLQESDAQPDASASVIRGARPHPLPAFPNFLIKTLDIAEWELRKLRHDPTDLFTRAVQPALWLVVFGEVFTRIRAIPTGQVRYLDFMAPGILAQSVLFISIFYGITIIWERDLGVIHKFLASPIPRSTIVLGKALSAGLRALPQALIIYTLALLLGVRMNWNPLAILGVILLVMLGAACFSTFSMIIACLLRTRDRVMGIGQVLTMPLFFASNAIYPISIMPSWLQVIARGNPPVLCGRWDTDVDAGGRDDRYCQPGRGYSDSGGDCNRAGADLWRALSAHCPVKRGNLTALTPEQK